ncbi:alginate O-acetyltransferase AlgF [Xanthobacter dioxanivorans]|uniref:Alginate biosynthesis protein AlgF n=1 Tax=Xanthobacter dioxanivorans TaxID=2528964 RepID=A0A974SJ83_9HYPH|nr:alginate O-acetyltransferase AlgF [Xanthobacter dioxanivorans]QRG08126.1 alginate O-acetyltransferase AlgF [Xanthobacter dioxanivorans]
MSASIPTGRRIAACLAVTACALSPALAQELTRLYAPKPPLGSAYVRVVDLARGGAPVAIGTAAAAPIPQGDTATIYRIVKGGAPLAVTIGGRPPAGDIVPAADAFSTIVVPASGPAVVIADPTEGRNDLKAQLRFYNLVPGCAGLLAVADGGPTVFEAVATNDTRQRAINPIEARLSAKCGEAAAPPLTLPPLKAGDHYSLFLMPGASGPVLTGQRDETEPYRGPAN